MKLKNFLTLINYNFLLKEKHKHSYCDRYQTQLAIIPLLMFLCTWIYTELLGVPLQLLEIVMGKAPPIKFQELGSLSSQWGNYFHHVTVMIITFGKW